MGRRRRLQQSAERGGSGIAKGSRARNAFCASTLASIDALRLPEPCPSFSSWLAARGEPAWRCTAARQHECALMMGLAHFGGTCW